jgi:hypothetical protein
MNSLVKVPPYSILNFQGKIVFIQNWCNITLNVDCFRKVKYNTFESRLWWGVLDTTLCDEVCQWLATNQWFSPGTSISSTNKNDRHDITEIVLKVALDAINLNQTSMTESGERKNNCYSSAFKHNNTAEWVYHYLRNDYGYICIYKCICIMVIFIGGGNRSTRRKPLICRKSLTNFIT